MTVRTSYMDWAATALAKNASRIVRETSLVSATVPVVKKVMHQSSEKGIESEAGARAGDPGRSTECGSAKGESGSSCDCWVYRRTMFSLHRTNLCHSCTICCLEIMPTRRWCYI